MPQLPQHIIPDSTLVPDDFWVLPFHPQADSASTLVKTENIITGTFLGPTGGSTFDTKLLLLNGNDWTGYLVLGLLTGIALLWYYFRSRLAQLFILPGFSRRLRSREQATESPAVLLNILLTLNFAFAITMFFFLVLSRYYPYFFDYWPVTRILWMTLLVVMVVFGFKMIIISVAGFMFNTRSAALYQRRLYSQLNNLTGILLLPLLFFYVFQPSQPFLIGGILLLLATQILKWYASLFNVISIPGISLFHIIVYLCTLEIIPVLVVIKLLNISLV